METEENDVMAVCFCSCFICLLKQEHCEQCYEFMAMQNGTYQYIKQMNALLES